MTDSRPTNIRWRILALILIASFVLYFLRVNVSIIGESMIRDLGLTEIHLGYILSAFAAGYAIFQLPGGIVGNRFGARGVIAVAALAWAALTVLTTLVPDSNSLGIAAVVLSLIVLRFLVGVTNAPFFPVTAGGTISNWFPMGSWGLPFGLQIAAFTLGAALCAPLLVWLLGIFGWRIALLVTAPSGLLLALVWWGYVRNFPADHQGVNDAERVLIDAGRPPPDSARIVGSWKAALANRDILLLTISYFCYNYVFYLFFSWFFYYMVEIRQFSQQQAGLFTSAQWIVGAIAGLGGGILCDWMVQKMGFRYGTRWLAVVSLVLCGLFLIGGALATQVHVAVVLLCLSFGCTQLGDNAYWVAAIAVGQRHAEVATGVLNTGGNIVGLVGGIMVPLIAAYFGWTIAVASGSIFAFIGAGLWFFIRTDRPMMEL